MARLIDLPYKKVHPLIRAFSDAGFDSELAAEIRKAGNATVAVALLRERFMAEAQAVGVVTIPLIHGCFNPAERIIEAFRARNAARGWGFTDEAFAALPTAPAYTDDREVAVVLSGLMPGKNGVSALQRTFDEYWLWAAEQQHAQWRWDQLLGDPEHLRFLEGITHEPGKLFWRRIKLNADKNRKPADVRSPQTSPSFDILAMAGQHPERIRQMNGDDRPYLWLPGLEVTVPGGDPWQRVPGLDFDRDDRQIKLDAHPSDDRNSHWAVPSFLQE